MENKVQWTEEERKLRSKLEEISSKSVLISGSSSLASVFLPITLCFYDQFTSGTTVVGYNAGFSTFLFGVSMSAVSLLPAIYAEKKLTNMIVKKIKENYGGSNGTD